MKFYELPQEVQEMLVERQRDYITSCMDWLEDLFPLINSKINEELTDGELASWLFLQGTTETTTGNWIFTLDDLDGRTPEQALDILYDYGYHTEILDAECTDDTLDIIFALDVCPNAEQEEED